jgi:5-carboxymethyl-2-hydroxymuconate isomerase
MPHLIIEYSANLEPELDVAGLVRATHDAALATGVFPLGGVRTRAQRREHHRVADGDPENCFVHLDIRIAAGRPLEVRKRAGDAIFAAVTDALAPHFKKRPLGISMEMGEINPETSWKQNNLHDIVAKRAAGNAIGNKGHVG